MEILELSIQSLDPAAQLLPSLLELIFLDEAGLIRIQQAPMFVTNATQLLLSVLDLPREE
jgi:hypothetical protein